MESFSLLSSVTLGVISSFIVQLLKRPELNFGPLKYIKTGKIAVFIVCFIAVIGYSIYLGTIWTGDDTVLIMNFLKVLVSAVLTYITVVGQLGI